MRTRQTLRASVDHSSIGREGDIVGQLFDAVEKIKNEIDHRGMDASKTLGEISLMSGFFVAIIFPHTPDDPEKLVRLEEAAMDVLGLNVHV